MTRLHEVNAEEIKMSKPKVATISLAGCFGCHMSIMDIDLRIIDLLKKIDLDKSPLTDIKKFSGPVDIGIIEGGVCNDENVEVLRDFRKNCKTLIVIGECAIMGGLPALRNSFSLEECLEEAYINGPTIKNHQNVIPCNQEIPKILDKVYPCHEVVRVDYTIPGCPPPAEAIWQVLTDLLQGREPKIDYEYLKYD